MSKLIANLDAVRIALRQSEEVAAELIAGLSDAQANWQPNEGRAWSIRQCLDHLARVNRDYAVALQDAVANCPPGKKGQTTKIAPGWFGRWFIRQQEPPVKLRVKTLAKLVPTDRGDVNETLREFQQSHNALRLILESAKEVDLNRLRFKNPFISIFRFTVGTAFLLVNAHDRRHLWQAEQVKKVPGYPAN